jgi:hypothetical protein
MAEVQELLVVPLESPRILPEGHQLLTTVEAVLLVVQGRDPELVQAMKVLEVAKSQICTQV